MEYPQWQHRERHQTNLYPDGHDAWTGDADAPHAPHDDDGISLGDKSVTMTERSTSTKRQRRRNGGMKHDGERRNHHNL